MRLLYLSISGITEAFPNSATVNFEALGPGLIALVGENGVGKSTLIGSVFAALFRQLPGQKRSLYDFCTKSQPEIDLTFSVDGNRYRSLLKIDPRSRQMESYLFDGQGVALANARKMPTRRPSGSGLARLSCSRRASSPIRRGRGISWDSSAANENICLLLSFSASKGFG